MRVKGLAIASYLLALASLDIFKNKERRQNRRSRTLRVNHEAAIVQSSTALAE
jgi:hypothetical protein